MISTNRLFADIIVITYCSKVCQSENELFIPMYYEEEVASECYEGSRYTKNESRFLSTFILPLHSRGSGLQI